MFELIGDLPSLESGESSPIHQWHYAPKLQPCEIAFLEHTPTGCSAWDNAKCFKPVKADGSPEEIVKDIVETKRKILEYLKNEL